MVLSPHYQKFLEQLDVLPDTAAVPLPVAALHEGVSVKTIKRNYPRVPRLDHVQRASKRTGIHRHGFGLQQWHAWRNFSPQSQMRFRR